MRPRQRLLTPLAARASSFVTPAFASHCLARFSSSAMTNSVSSSSDAYDVVVVGAGLMGSSAAYYATSNKTAAGVTPRVLLLEQFELLHALGSSHGSSRVFRIAYPNATYARMCIDSLRMWNEIEAASGETLLEMTGELDFADDKAKLQGICDVLTQLQQPFEELSGDQVNQRFPGFSLPSNAHAVFNASAAILNPTRAMDALQTLARRQGAMIRDRSRVVSVKQSAGEEEGLVEIKLDDGTTFLTRQCIVTVGPWTQKLLAQQSNGTNVAVRPQATFATYWKTAKNELYTPATFPVFIDYGGSGFYGLPLQDEAVGVKVLSHLGPDVDPDTRQEITQTPAEDIANLQQFIRKNLPHVDASAVTKTDLCMYSMTEDHDFILDFVDAPHDDDAPSSGKKLVLGAGFSGHGAKMTPVIGQILASLALKGKTEYPIDKFALERLR